MKTTPTTLKLTIDDPRQMLADFRGETLKPEDLDCFGTTLDIIEHDLPHIASRANAWATGDVAALRAMSPRRRQVDACLSAWTGTETVRKRGLTDIEPSLRQRWLEAAVKALDEHAVSFAMLSIDDLLREDGSLAGLRDRGYRIRMPDDIEEADREAGTDGEPVSSDAILAPVHSAPAKDGIR